VLNLLDVRYPVVIYPSGGIGDHLVALPALRALIRLFPDKLHLICVPGSRSILFSRMPLRSVHEVEFFDSNGGEIGMRALPPTAAPTDASNRRINVEEDLARGAECHSAPLKDPWSFDAGAVARKVGGCDLLISLTPWHSTSADRLLEILSPGQSIGFSRTFKTPLAPGQRRNVADTFFTVANALDPSLKIEDFVGLPVVPARYRERARIIRSQVPAGLQVLAVHVDTIPTKMWSLEGFVNVVEEFLQRHADFAALIVGCPDHLWVDSLRGTRMGHCFPVELPTSLAVVGDSDLFLGIDSCMLHCADLHLVPGVGLFGPTDDSIWGFRFACHRHIRGNGTMNSISEGEVLSALESLLISDETTNH
jgi:hypothetical protein